MYIFLLIVHVLIALATIFVILMQTSKGNGLDSTLGGAANQVLGGQAAPELLKKITRGLVAAFFIVCILLAFQHNTTRRATSSSAVEKMRQQAQAEQANEPVPENVQPLEELPAELPAQSATDSL